MKTVLIVVGCLIWSTLAQAQQDDYQLRLTFHKQIVFGNEQGLAFWTNMPDVTQTEPNRSVLLGGWLHKEPSSWQEVMGGALVTFDGKAKPLFDVRLYSTGKRTDIYSEIMLRPDLVNMQAFVTTPLPKKWWSMRAELEWDIVAPLARPDQVVPIPTRSLIGPRVSIKVPKIPSLQTATVCFFDLHGGVVVRTYVSVNR
jgi:hypothetical protein